MQPPEELSSQTTLDLGFSNINTTQAPYKTPTRSLNFASFFPPITAWGLKRASLMAQGVKILPANARDTGDVGLLPGSGRFPGEGNGKPLQDSCLNNPMN